MCHYIILQRLLITFQSSYLVQLGFSADIKIFTNKRNRLDICARGDLRSLPANMKPDMGTFIISHQRHLPLFFLNFILKKIIIQ